ncbi:MAG: hypothetical protein HF973_12610 [Chloroflexi bacterium]|nr:hypothetical protein [Chloroflexota bacterium]
MDDLEDLTKEVYARFGLAYYLGEVLHRGLCNAYTLLSFEKADHITRSRFEEKLAYAFSLTLGQIIKEVKEFLPSELDEQLQFALKKRNFLAHHFWYERIHLMGNKQGLVQMLYELDDMSQLFSDLDRKVNENLESRRIELGVTDEVINSLMIELTSGITEEQLIPQRRLKKQERLVKVWDVKITDDLVAQIFELEDGTFWQLCDTGLGWSRFERPSPDWQKNQTINEYLPANINPRPTDSKPWNYEFRLKKGMILWVKLGKQKRSYIWGLRKN